jgi:protein-arginine kinase activator protein McsA
VGYVDQAKYEKAVRIRDQIKKLQAQFLGSDGEY